MYSIWLLEYAHVQKQHIGSVLSGQHNKGYRELAFTYMLLKGNGLTILIDTGTNGENEATLKLHERDGVLDWQPPEKVLAKVGVTPEDVDYILISHAHYDHMDNTQAFPNAHFFVQEKEILGWVWAMTREKKFRFPNMALNSQDIFDALHLIVENRMTLVDGEVKNVLPDIDLYPAYDGHSFGSQIIVINNPDGVWENIGDLAYVQENLTGIDNNGTYVPVGLAVGSPYNITKSLDDMMKIAKSDMHRIIIGHEPNNWTKFPTKKYDDGLHVAEIVLAEGGKSIFVE